MVVPLTVKKKPNSEYQGLICCCKDKKAAIQIIYELLNGGFEITEMMHKKPSELSNFMSAEELTHVELGKLLLF
jgi:hypothetical protein